MDRNLARKGGKEFFGEQKRRYPHFGTWGNFAFSVTGRTGWNERK
jgi:hypothetical protein